MIRFLLTCLLIAGSIYAQNDASVDGPVLGYVANAGDLRPLYGIPGAVTWGPAVLSGVDTVAAGPKRDVAIACASGRVELVPLARPDERTLLFEGGCSRIVFSHQGRAAVVFDADAQALRVIRGLPDHPDTAKNLEWTGTLVAVAVSDDGDRVVAASEAATLELLSDGSRRLIPGVGGAAAIGFSGQTAWIAPRDQDAIIEMDFRADPAVVRGSIPEPASAIAISADSGLLAFIRRDSGALVLSRLADQERIEASGSCTALALEPLGGNAVFRLVTNVGGSCILDADLEAPRVFILPGATQ